MTLVFIVQFKVESKLPLDLLIYQGSSTTSACSAETTQSHLQGRAPTAESGETSINYQSLCNDFSSIATEPLRSTCIES